MLGTKTKGRVKDDPRILHWTLTDSHTQMGKTGGFSQYFLALYCLYFSVHWADWSYQPVFRLSLSSYSCFF